MKKLTAIILAVVLCLSLVSCGKNSKGLKEEDILGTWVLESSEYDTWIKITFYKGRVARCERKTNFGTPDTTYYSCAWEIFGDAVRISKTGDYVADSYFSFTLKDSKLIKTDREAVYIRG